MEAWVLGILRDEKRRRMQPLEVKRLNNNYYLYRSTTRWDKESRRIRKVSEYLGRITREGVVAKCERNIVRSVYHYGDARFLFLLAQEELVGLLEKCFPGCWREVLAFALVKTLRPVPLKRVRSVWETLYLSREIDASLSPKSLALVLRQLGSDYAGQKRFFDELVRGSRTLIFDLSSMFSHSQNINIAERGYNKEHLYLRQVNFLLFFSFTRRLPVMLRPLPGSVRDIKALKAVLDEEVKARKNCVLVLDTGFASYPLARRLEKEGFRFIVPLRRNYKAIDYDAPLENMFTYRERGIKWAVQKKDEWFLYLYEDVKLRAEEETTFISRVKAGEKKRGEYERASRRFGKITLLSNIKASGEEAYLMYKDRENIEAAFDALKNELENDKTHLQDDETLRGYFFASFLSLYLYYKTLNKLKEKKLTHKISVNDLLHELSKTYQIQIDKKTKLSEIPKKTEELTKTLDMNIFPK